MDGDIIGIEEDELFALVGEPSAVVIAAENIVGDIDSA